MLFNKKFWSDVASQTKRMFKRSPDPGDNDIKDLVKKISGLDDRIANIVDSPVGKIQGEKDAPDRRSLKPGLKEGPGVDVLELRVWSEPETPCAHKYRKVVSPGKHIRSLAIPRDQEHEDFVCDLCTHQLCYTRAKKSKGTQLRPAAAK